MWNGGTLRCGTIAKAICETVSALPVEFVRIVGRVETVIASVSVAIQPFRDKRLEKRDKGIVLCSTIEY